MCNAFSCIVLKNGTVSWKFGVDSHDKILELNNIPDNTADADKVKFCRVEISPANKNYLNPDKWIFKIDQKPIPNWMEEEHELACWDAFRFWKQELDRILVYKPIIHPFEIEPPEITDEHIALLREWASVLASVGDSVLASVWNSVWASVWNSVWNSVWDSVWDSVGAYVGSFFALSRESWKYTEKIETNEYPFQSAVPLWEMGLVPSFYGKLWRLHSKNGIVWEGKI